MTFHLPKTITALLLAAIMITMAASTASALQRRTRISDRGFYLAFYVPFNSVNGDFKDETYLQYSLLQRRIYVPNIDAGAGFGFGGGIKFSQAALEVNYLRTTHDATVNDVARDAVLNMANIDLKYHFVPRSMTQPYLMIGLCIPWMEVDDAATSATGDIVSNAKYRGYGLNVGGGATMHLNDQIAFTGGATYRWVAYNHFTGIYGDKVNWDSSFDGSGFSFNLGIVFKFPWDY